MAEIDAKNQIDSGVAFAIYLTYDMVGELTSEEFVEVWDNIGRVTRVISKARWRIISKAAERKEAK